jgi:hypothetical protein
MFYPYGIYDKQGILKACLSKSASFASNLHDQFTLISKEDVSPELDDEFSWYDWDGMHHCEVKYCLIENLPKGDFIKRGFFLVDDVKAYETNKYIDEIFYDTLTPVEYAARLKNELLFGPPRDKYDEEGGKFDIHSASEYMYYAYPDYNYKEYEAHILRTVADSLFNYIYDDGEMEAVILMTEG